METNNMKILAVAAHPDTVEALRAAVADGLRGARLLTVNSDSEALETAHREDPDVILIDIATPGIDAHAICRRFKEDERLQEIPVLFLTTHAIDRGALEAGAEGFLHTPLDEIELMAQARAMAKIKAASRFQRQEKEQLAALVAQRTRALEQELAERVRAEENYQSLFREMLNGFALHEIICDAQGTPVDYRFLAVNPAFECLTGLKARDVVGRTVLDILPGTERHWIEIYGKVALTGEPAAFENYHAELDKHFAVTAFRPALGQFACIVADITESARAAEALQESEERFRCLVESAPEAIFVQSGGRFVYINRAMLALFGASKAEELLGTDFMERMAPEWREAIIDRIRVQRETGQPAPLMEQEYLRLDGSRVPVETTAVAIRFEGRDANLVFVRDITERRQAEREREATTEVLRLIHEHAQVRTLMSAVTRFLQKWTGCEAVGIRLKDGDDYPYYETRGFPQEFVLAESSLCERDPQGQVKRDADGNPVLECMCGNILRGRFDPAMPFFTERGSFWSNCTTGLLASTAEADRQAQTRNRCHGEGYESVALIALRYGADTLGLVQINDKRPDRFTPEMIAHIEHLAGQLGLALAERLAEAALRESEERFRRIFEECPIGIATSNADFHFLRANAAFCRMMGRSESELQTLSFRDITHPDDVGRDEKEIRRLLRGEIPVYNAEKRYLQGNGEVVWGGATVTTVRDSGGSFQCFLAMVEDITERKRAENALAVSEIRYRRLFEAAHDGILILDAETGMIVDVNPFLVELLGYSREEFLGKSLWDLGCLADALASQDSFRRLQAQGYVRYENLPLEAADGRRLEVEFVSNVYLADHRKVIQCNIRDMTERRREGEERVRLETQLIQAQKMESVGRLAGGVAHDFNNMLGVILGYAELALAKTAPDNPIHADLEAIRKAAERSSDLTRQLLAFARRQTVAPKVLDLNEAVGRMLKMIERLIGEDIDLVWLPGEKLRSVRIDPSQIDQILANLCVNARDAIADVGRITIETKTVTLDEAYCAEHAEAIPGEYVMLAVSDDGCGMDKETLEYIFEPFFTTKGVGESTGLGLATVYGIVKQNNGFINVYSEPGHGTTFKIYLPQSSGEVDAVKRARPAARASRGHEIILLVEDEPAILKIAAMMLEKQGYTVLKANTPGEAIRLARESAGDIHLLMTDVVMPEMNGRDLAKNLLSLYPDLKRLFMSGYTADVIAHRGVLDEGVYFIQKPFTSEDLAVKVREALDAG